jgi:hypothetical protein
LISQRSNRSVDLQTFFFCLFLFFKLELFKQSFLFIDKFKNYNHTIWVCQIFNTMKRRDSTTSFWLRIQIEYKCDTNIAYTWFPQAKNCHISPCVCVYFFLNVKWIKRNLIHREQLMIKTNAYWTQTLHKNECVQFALCLD